MGLSPLIGISGIGYVLWFVFNHRAEGGFHGFVDVPSLVLLGIGPPCIMMLSHTLTDLWTGIRTLFGAMFGNQRRTQRDVIQILTMSSQLVRSEGLGALMQVRNRVKYELLREGLSMIVNDFSADEIKHNLQARIDAKQSHMLIAANLFENMSKVCPASGMMGTLIGLARMLSNMSDPSTIGAGMAMAIVGTLYGLFLGTVVYAPFGEKISLESEKSLEIDHLVMDGVLHLKGKKSSAHFKGLVSTYGHGKSHPAAARGAS